MERIVSLSNCRVKPGVRPTGRRRRPCGHLTKITVKYRLRCVRELEVVADPAAAVAMLDPVRARILAMLSEPASATTLAKSLGEARQKVNYHLRHLEQHGLVELVETRQRRGLTERVMVASARSYLLSPAVLGDNAVDATRTDRLSAQYLIALAARLVREVADLTERAALARRPLATLAIDTDIRFASAAERAAFTAELAEAVATIAARYHDEAAPQGRWHRLLVAAYPRPAAPLQPEAASPTAASPEPTVHPGNPTSRTQEA